MSEVGNYTVLHLQVYRDGGAAKLGMRLGSGVGLFEPADAGDVSGKTKNFRVVDIVYHDFPVHRRSASIVCRSAAFHSLVMIIYNAPVPGTARQVEHPIHGSSHAAFGQTSRKRLWSVQLAPS